MDDLVEWLRAQLDEDERVAQEAGGRINGDYIWHANRDSKSPGLVGTLRGNVVDYGRGLGGFSLAEHAEHIALHDPARVLREVEAKRQIIDRCVQARRDQGIYGEDAQEYVAEDVLTLLALPYSDRPGYREEWRP